VQPSPDTLRTTRNGLGLTQAQAARLAFVSLRAWVKYESGERAIPAPTWALFRLLAGITTLGQLRREIR
jgi:transcriptional regulator with XRE-family HTH domain